MLWNKISQLPNCQRVAPPGSGKKDMFLFRIEFDQSCWLVAPYESLTVFATALRENSALREFLGKNAVRIGLRETDKAPADVARQPRFGDTVAGASGGTNFYSARTKTLAQPVNPLIPAPENRRTDREANVKGFWETQTPQSHHIVEYNNLEKLGLSQPGRAREMDYERLPAVLLAAEFRQKYISMILKPPQSWPTTQLRGEIIALYQKLYETRSPLFKPLWSISRTILTEGGLIK